MWQSCLRGSRGVARAPRRLPWRHEGSKSTSEQFLAARASALHLWQPTELALEPPLPLALTWQPSIQSHGPACSGSPAPPRAALLLGARPLDLAAAAAGLRHLQARGAASQAGPAPALDVEKGKKILRSVRKMGKKAAARGQEIARRTARKSGSLLYALARDPRIVAVWYADIRKAVVHFGRWVATGFRLFGSNVRASFYLMKRVGKGYPLTVKERNLLVTTTSDCLKLIPFSFFIIVPFAEVALPFFLRLFPNMLPSTFFEQKFDNATLARKLKAKQDLAGFWQQVVLQRTKEIVNSTDHKYADKAEELQEFQEKLAEGTTFPSLKELLRFSKLFQEEVSLPKMSVQQLAAMSRVLGLPQASTRWRSVLEVQLRHHIVSLRREDRDYLWEGIDSLAKKELIEACRKRAIRFHEVTETEMRRDLSRWLELSANSNIPTTLLLWVQSFYLKAPVDEAVSLEELQLKVAPVDDEVDTKEDAPPNEMFALLAERQKVSLEQAQQKLEELRRDIADVIGGPKGEAEALLDQVDSTDEVLQKAVAMAAGKEAGEARDSSSDPSEFPVEQLQERRQLLEQRVASLEEALHLHREVILRQKGLLDHQLRFMTSMHDNVPTKNLDANKLLLDNKIRLVEMMQSFERSTLEIEQLLAQLHHGGGAKAGGGPEQQSGEAPSERAWHWRPPAATSVFPARQPETVSSEVKASGWDDLDAAAAIDVSTAAAPTRSQVNGGHRRLRHSSSPEAPRVRGG